MELVGKFVRREQADHAALGHRIDLDQPARHPRQHLALQFGGEGRGGAVFELQRGQIEVVEASEVHQPLILHRHQHGDGGAVGLGVREPLRAIELPHHPHASSRQQNRQESDHRGVRIERGRGERAHLQPCAEIGERRRRELPPAHLVGMDDALGDAGRPAGIDDVEGVFRLRHEVRGAAAGRGHPGIDALQRHADQAGHEIRPQLRRLGAVYEQVDRTRILRHAFELFGRSAGGERRGHAPGAHGGEEHQRVFDRGRPEDRHRLPALEPRLHQPRRQPLDEADEFRPIDLALVVTQREIVALDARPFHQDSGEAAEGFGEAGDHCLSAHGGYA